MFIAIKTDDGRIKGKISFYCKVLHVSRQAFNKYLKTKDAPWKYQELADAMIDICSEAECNDTYGRIRMYQALQLKPVVSKTKHGEAGCRSSGCEVVGRMMA